MTDNLIAELCTYVKAREKNEFTGVTSPEESLHHLILEYPNPQSLPEKTKHAIELILSNLKDHLGENATLAGLWKHVEDLDTSQDVDAWIAFYDRQIADLKKMPSHSRESREMQETELTRLEEAKAETAKRLEFVSIMPVMLSTEEGDRAFHEFALDFAYAIAESQQPTLEKELPFLTTDTPPAEGGMIREIKQLDRGETNER